MATAMIRKRFLRNLRMYLYFVLFVEDRYGGMCSTHAIFIRRCYCRRNVSGHCAFASSALIVFGLKRMWNTYLFTLVLSI